MDLKDLIKLFCKVYIAYFCFCLLFGKINDFKILLFLIVIISYLFLVVYYTKYETYYNRLGDIIHLISFENRYLEYSLFLCILSISLILFMNNLLIVLLKQ